MIYAPYWNADPKIVKIPDDISSIDKKGLEELQLKYNKIAGHCKSCGLIAKSMFVNFKDYDICSIYKNANESNSQFLEVMRFQDERNDLIGTGKVEAYESELRRNGPRYKFCDGTRHYRSFGTDPNYLVLGFCPIYKNRVESETIRSQGG